MLPKGTAPDENSSFDAHGYWELLHVCYGIFLHKVDKQNLTNCDTAVRYELHVATGWASVAAMAHGSRWELVVSANDYCKLLCVPYAIFLHQSCRLNAIVMLRFGPSLAFDQISSYRSFWCDAPCHDCCLVTVVCSCVHFVLRTCVSKFNALWTPK